jgi:Crinkler effector protein N-terminal domain
VFEAETSDKPLQELPQGMLGEHSLPSDNTRRLCCLIEGQDTVFPVTVAGDKDIIDLKELVHEKASTLLDTPFLPSNWCL